MKMNRNEMEALYAFGCPNLKATVERLRMVAALAPDPVAKKLFYMLSVKLSAEGVERWYRCFYRKLRVLKDHREGCYDETDEDPPFFRKHIIQSMNSSKSTIQENKGFNRTVISITSWEFHPGMVLMQPYPLPATLLTLGLWL